MSAGSLVVLALCMIVVNVGWMILNWRTRTNNWNRQTAALDEAIKFRQEARDYLALMRQTIGNKTVVEEFRVCNHCRKIKDRHMVDIVDGDDAICVDCVADLAAKG